MISDEPSFSDICPKLTQAIPLGELARSSGGAVTPELARSLREAFAHGHQ